MSYLGSRFKATGDFVRHSMRTAGLKRQIKAKKKQVAKIHASKANLGSVMQGGHKGGRSMSAASRLASDPKNFR